MHEMIEHLDDETAIRVLVQFAEGQFPGDRQDKQTGEDLRQALFASSSGETPQGDATAGAVARQGLLVFAEDARNHEALLALTRNPRPRSFSIVGGVAVLAAAVVVLQTRVEFERDKGGRMRLKIEKGAASNDVLKKFMGLLAGFVRVSDRATGSGSGS